MSSTKSTEKIYGSYEQNQTKCTVITGHNNTKYLVGGDARFNIRSKILDWKLCRVRQIRKSIIKIIFKIPSDNEVYDDPKLINEIVEEVINLKPKDFIKCLENSLDLNESLKIEFRRLFYNIQSYDIDDKTRTEYCPFEPIVRIKALLTEMPELLIPTRKAAQIPLYIEYVNKFLEKKKSIYKSIKKEKMEAPNYIVPDYERTKDEIRMENSMDKFLAYYEHYYKVLDALEEVNIEIARNLDIIAVMIGQGNRHVIKPQIPSI